jgi:pimeloyl-ACP methyl ester carboxylesterase
MRVRASQAGRTLRYAILGAATFAVTTAFTQVAMAEPSNTVETIEGKLADGTAYLLRKPANWNGIVINDLDGILRRNAIPYRMMLEAGYGTAAAERREYDRKWTQNLNEDLRRTQEALELFKKTFGKPKLVIAYGRSAGGGTALQAAEARPDTVDGVVALCASMKFLGHTGDNFKFDFFYILKALLAPHDERLLTHALPARDHRPVLDYWKDVLQAAAKTPEGRARIALAITLVQYPIYGDTPREKGYTRPDFDDPQAVTDAMIRNLPRLVSRLSTLRVVGEKDFPPDLPIPGTLQPDVTGNDGAVYADYWKVSNPSLQRVTEHLYAQAGLKLADDLARLDAAPRKPMDREAFRKGLIGRGLPTVPVFRVDNLGDSVTPPLAARAYDELVEWNGLGDRYRTAYVEDSGHCYFRPEQEFVAVEVMRERLQTGKWPDTSVAALNARAGIKPGDGRIFVEGNLAPYPGVWRLKAYTDAFEPATFSTAKTLVESYEASVVSKVLKRKLLAQLSAAERAANRGRVAEAHSALDRFVDVVESIPDGVVRTRLLAAAHQLRRTKD